MAQRRSEPRAAVSGGPAQAAAKPPACGGVAGGMRAGWLAACGRARVRACACLQVLVREVAVRLELVDLLLRHRHALSHCCGGERYEGAALDGSGWTVRVGCCGRGQAVREARRRSARAASHLRRPGRCGYYELIHASSRDRTTRVQVYSAFVGTCSWRCMSPTGRGLACQHDPGRPGFVPVSEQSARQLPSYDARNKDPGKFCAHEDSPGHDGGRGFTGSFARRGPRDVGAARGRRRAAGRRAGARAPRRRAVAVRHRERAGARPGGCGSQADGGARCLNSAALGATRTRALRCIG